MKQFHINRSIETPEGSVTKLVAVFDSLGEALDTLYSQAKRRGYEVAVDNSVDAIWGFCLWQIHVKVGNWRYFVTSENEVSQELFGAIGQRICPSSCRSKHFRVTIGIYDANTQIKLGECSRMTWSRSSYRAECFILDEVKRAVAKVWAIPSLEKRYGITSKKLLTMYRDHIIDPLESYTFKVERCRRVL